MFLQQEYDFGSDVIGQALQDLTGDVGDELLKIIVAFFSIFWDFLVNVIAGYFIGDNPAIFFIGVIFLATAFIVWRGGK